MTHPQTPKQNTSQTPLEKYAAMLGPKTGVNEQRTTLIAEVPPELGHVAVSREVLTSPEGPVSLPPRQTITVNNPSAAQRRDALGGYGQGFR